MNILNVIDHALVAKNESAPPRDYVGASSIGNGCLRAVQYRYQNKPAIPFDAKTLRTFSIGHALEAEMLSWLRCAGFVIETQIKFTAANDRFRGHCDGVITVAPDNCIATPCIWECKTANDKSFSAMRDKGVAAAKPAYATQIALYQAYINEYYQGVVDNPALFTVINKNTSELYTELIPFDSHLAQQASDSAVLVLRASEANETLPGSPSYMCRWCDFRNSCDMYEG